MTQLIQIEGEMVRVLETEVLRQVRLEDFLPHIEHRPAITIGMLPKSAVFVHWDESNPTRKRIVILAERTAGMTTMVYNARRYRLSMPWTYMKFEYTTTGDPMNGVAWQIKNTEIFWAREQITDHNSELRTALIPNVDNRGQICWGNTGVPARLPLGVRVDRTLEEFYKTQFTHSNGAGSPWQSETGLDNWKRWDDESKLDPACYKNFPEWNTTTLMRRMTVGGVMAEINDRTIPVMVEGAIPEMPTPMTFGRAEEWAHGLTAVDRYRLHTALTNMHADDPATMTPPPPVAAGALDPHDLGGEPI